MNFMKRLWKHRALAVMALPGFLILFFFDYVAMGGLILAFKNFDYRLGIWNSPWNGLDNFKFLIASKSVFFTITRNTLIYYAIFTVLGMLLEVSLAIAMDQLVFKRIGKVMQSIFVVPAFISFTAVQFIVYAFLSPDKGMINNLFGLSTRWYLEAEYWPMILTIVKMWSSTGYGAVLFLSVLAGIDPGLYESAQIDGAGKWQQIWHITLPFLKPMVTVMLLLSVGGILHSDTGLFYQVTRNSGPLYDTTQVLDSYILNSVFHNSNFGFTAAASFFQSVFGAALILIANMIVRKINPENALF
ncbi:MAG: sugar ABC transporter permease [Lachnospiraceae bacterium]|nr:sugar ABC transporter permease [Lachnospiraceae bacterium]